LRKIYGFLAQPRNDGNVREGISNAEKVGWYRKGDPKKRIHRGKVPDYSGEAEAKSRIKKAKSEFVPSVFRATDRVRPPASWPFLSHVLTE